MNQLLPSSRVRGIGEDSIPLYAARSLKEELRSSTAHEQLSLTAKPESFAAVIIIHKVVFSFVVGKLPKESF